ncbi:MAG: hypothetical protein R3C53_15450 [Pirellulaceae bacterium]
MTLSIRNFLNTDVEAVCRVWNAHYADQGYSSQIDPLRLELCSLAKPYFDAHELLIAQVRDEIVGFAHVSGPIAAEQTQAVEAASAGMSVRAIAALCVVPRPDEAEVASALLRRCDDLCTDRTSVNCMFKPMLPLVGHYLGLGPGDSMIGLSSAEHRVGQWLKDAGYAAQVPTSQWELDMTIYQPPVDRVQVQVRRAAHVNRQVDEPQLPWWQACVLGHTEPTAFYLTDRAQRRVLQDILFWMIAPELQSEPESIAWLWPPHLEPPPQHLQPNSSNHTRATSFAPVGFGASAAASNQPSPRDHLLFLLAESLRELQTENIESVRTVTTADDNVMSSLLKRLGFRTRQSGVVFSKQLCAK